MNSGKGLRRPHFKDTPPKDPAIRRWGEWLPANRSFYLAFLRWLKETSYSNSAQNIYGCAARQAIGFLDKPYWAIDPETDLERVQQHFTTRPITPSTQECYHKGLLKFGDYLRLRCQKPAKEKSIHWDYFLNGLPTWLAEDVQSFIAYRRRRWRPVDNLENALSLVSPITRVLRWASTHYPITRLTDLAPEVWYAYLDARLAANIGSKTLNRELDHLLHLLRYFQDQGREICPRMLLVEGLNTSHALPKDIPIPQLQRLIHEIQHETASSNAGERRMGIMDLAWVLLMLHSGLRTGEVRRLRVEDVNWEGRRLRIEQSKGLKDRYVYLSTATINAMQAYQAVRGPAEHLPGEFFIYRHAPLCRTYCFQRLRTYGKRSGVKVTPHQLRHSCATLLLNAGAPILTVQMILGHKRVDTTLGYARLYDGTVAADYFSAMHSVEQRLSLPKDRLAPPHSMGQLVAMVDALRQGTLNDVQRNLVQELRIGLMAFAFLEENMEDVKVQEPAG